MVETVGKNVEERRYLNRVKTTFVPTYLRMNRKYVSTSGFVIFVPEVTLQIEKSHKRF